MVISFLSDHCVLIISCVSFSVSGIGIDIGIGIGFSFVSIFLNCILP